MASSGTAGNGDLFGPDPGLDPLAYYCPPDARADIYAAADPAIARHWRGFASGLAAQAHGDMSSLQSYFDRHVEDLGLAFRLTGDEQERSWPLNPMPLLISAQEWAGIEAGLVQRAELLEAVVADIYGPQRLVAEGHLPASVVSGSGHFARRMVGTKPPGRRFLHVYAVDLARGPTGEWRVLADRVRLATGIGYALENRLAMQRATGGLLAAIGTRRQSGFFEGLRCGIAANCARSDPRIGLLTPGRFNQSYPEQAHLARHLGFSLVEGRDLTVREGKLYVRTIGGLKRIDALWRWINARDIDPLAFDARSRIGVPGLIDAATNGVVLANWPGAGVIESRAMPAFLPRLAPVLLGEDLKLPNAATWWCGGEEERAHVLGHLDELVISSSFRNAVPGLEDGRTQAGSSLTDEARARIEQGIAVRPMDYTAQEVVSLSTTPVLAKGRFEPRGFTMRAFLTRDENGEWFALQGGFARVSERGDLRNSLMGLGDISADLCIVEPVVSAPVAGAPRLEAPAVRREQGLLPSQAADNLFWLGRYGERAHQTVRIVRALIEQASLAGARPRPSTTVQRLADLLRVLGAVPKESVKWVPSRLAGIALSERTNPGSVRALTLSARGIALLLRDRLTRDAWRAIQRTLPSYIPGDMESLANSCDSMVERFAGLARLMADGMSRGPAWHFLDMGLCLERGSMVVRAAQAIVPGSASAEDLSALLDLIDGQSLYRSRYLAMPFIAPVFDMVLLDPSQPRGLAFQVAQIEAHLATLPVVREDGMVEPPLRMARALVAKLESLDAEQVDTKVLIGIGNDLAALSDAISDRYFLQAETPGDKRATSLLG